MVNTVRKTASLVVLSLFCSLVFTKPIKAQPISNHPKYSVISTDGTNGCVLDNFKQVLYFYTTDPAEKAGTDLYLRGTINLKEVGKKSIQPTLIKIKRGVNPKASVGKPLVKLEGPRFDVVFTEGTNLCVTDNLTNNVYYYTVDRGQKAGAALKLRAITDLSGVGQPMLDTKLLNGKHVASPKPTTMMSKGGPKYSVVDTDGTNVRVVDNVTNKLYFYTIDRDAKPGAEFIVRGFVDLKAVGKSEIVPTPLKRKSLPTAIKQNKQIQYGPRYAIVFTDGINLCVTDNKSNIIFYYTMDRKLPPGSPLNLRASINLAEVGTGAIQPKLYQKPAELSKGPNYQFIGGPTYSVVFSIGTNLCVADNRKNVLYFYTADRGAQPGSEIKLRATFNLNQVGQAQLTPELFGKKQ